MGSAGQSFLRSEKEFEDGDEAFASELLSLSESLLDVGLGIAPGSSLVKDTYELIFGTNMVTGRELTELERGISLVGVGLGVVSFGTAGGVATTLLRSKRLAKLADHFGHVSEKLLRTPKAVFEKALDVAESVVDSARKWDNVQALIHTVQGTSKIAADGNYKLVKGLHTKMGLDHFVKMNAKAVKNLSIKNVTKFDKVNPTEHILKETLDNGVTRIQLPRSAFANGDRFRSAYVKTPAGDVHQGAKTLFPDSYSVDEIAKAANHVVEQNKGNVSSLIKGKYKNINVVVQRDKNTGKIISTYPEWIQ